MVSRPVTSAEEWQDLTDWETDSNATEDLEGSLGDQIKDVTPYSGPDLLSSLPLELLRLIGSNLEKENLFTLACVNQSINVLVQDHIARNVTYCEKLGYNDSEPHFDH